MSRWKEIATVCGALSLVVGVGILMQSSETASRHYGEGDSQESGPTSVQPSPRTDRVASVETRIVPTESIELTAADAPAPQQVTMSPAPVLIEEPVLAVVAEPEAVTPSCAIGAQATAGANALIQLDISAPCHGEELITIHHGSLAFREIMDADGNLSIAIPAFERNARIFATFENGEGIATEAIVPDVDKITRVGVQWAERNGFQLHARENGADYGDRGHVWREAPDASGSLISLGDPSLNNALRAEVYTLDPDTSEVLVTVEAEVTLRNCGRDISAHVIDPEQDDAVQARKFSFSVPGCDSIGEFIRLNNVFEDLTIARR